MATTKNKLSAKAKSEAKHSEEYRAIRKILSKAFRLARRADIKATMSMTMNMWKKSDWAKDADARYKGGSVCVFIDDWKADEMQDGRAYVHYSGNADRSSYYVGCDIRNMLKAAGGRVEWSGNVGHHIKVYLPTKAGAN